MSVLLSVSKIIMPCLLLLFAFLLLFSKKELFSCFVKGAKEGAECCFNLLPTLLIVMCSVSMLFSSGAVDIVCILLDPLLSALSVDSALVPTIVLRPFSGSAVTAIADRLFRDFGADSDISKTACLLMGSTDTIIYTLSVYFSSAEIKRTRYALPASFIVLLFSVFVCTFVGKIML